MLCDLMSRLQELINGRAAFVTWCDPLRLPALGARRSAHSVSLGHCSAWGPATLTQSTQLGQLCTGGSASYIPVLLHRPSALQKWIFLLSSFAVQFSFEHPHFPVSLVKLRPFMLKISNGD